jgi:aryl-alcohol dehydrogenase-like predicted oxidoreductase
MSPLGAATAPKPDQRSILNYNPDMEYRRLGKTGLMVSAICVGGHWKGLPPGLGLSYKDAPFAGNDTRAVGNAALVKNRQDVLYRAMDLGVNYIDACSGPEVVVYSAALKSRRKSIYFGYSWGMKESRHAEWRSAGKLLQSLDEGLRAGQLDYVDLWRISMPMTETFDLGVLKQIEEGAMEALDKARQQGKARFTGVSTHNRPWLKTLIEEYPRQLQAVLFPYTADSKVMPTDSLFKAIQKHDVGVFGIKPFADGALFRGSAPNTVTAEEKDRNARLALRYILANPAITAPIPGLASIAQVDNAAKAVMERRKLDGQEKADLEHASVEMWANLRSDHQWLKNWEYV